MRYLYILPKDVAFAQTQKHFSAAHWIDLDNGFVLMSGRLHNDDDSHKEAFEKNVSVQQVAHDGDTVTESHAAMLAHLGVKAGHTAKQVRALAKQVFPTM
jgi:hypothetical protein